MDENQPKDETFIVQPLNVEALELHLQKLTAAYRSGLKFVEQQPSTVRRVVIVQTPQEATGPFESAFNRLLNVLIDRKLTIFPFVRFFMESHMRAKFESIVRQLRIELQALTDEDDVQYKKLSHMTKHFEESLKGISGWGKLIQRISTSKTLSTPITLLAPILTIYIGVDISSTSEIGAWFSQFAKPDGLPILAKLLQGIIGILSLIYLLFVPPIIQTGFVAKRAIFNGGITIPTSFNFRNNDISSANQWSHFPTTNVYHLENKVYEILGVKKTNELPLDLTLSYDTYYLPFWSLLIVFSVMNTLEIGNDFSYRDAIGPVIVLFVFGNRVWKAIKLYRHRKRQKNL